MTEHWKLIVSEQHWTAFATLSAFDKNMTVAVAMMKTAISLRKMYTTLGARVGVTWRRLRTFFPTLGSDLCHQANFQMSRLNCQPSSVSQKRISQFAWNNCLENITNHKETYQNWPSSSWASLTVIFTLKNGDRPGHGKNIYKSDCSICQQRSWGTSM